MKLDPFIMSLTALIEKSKGLDTYTFIPQMIREEIKDIIIAPVYVRDVHGVITSISYELKVGYKNNEKTAA